MSPISQVGHFLPVSEPGSGSQAWASIAPTESTGSISSDLELSALRFRPGTPLEVVFACRNAIIGAALKDGAVRIDATSAGRATRSRKGALSAPITARIVYALDGKLQTRQATVSCQINAAGQVVAVRSL
jgi:hypothetical protein